MPDLKKAFSGALQRLQSFREVPVPFLYGSAEKEPGMGFGACCNYPHACSDPSVIAQNLTLVIFCSDTVLSASFSVSLCFFWAEKGFFLVSVKFFIAT